MEHDFYNDKLPKICPKNVMTIAQEVKDRNKKNLK